MKPKLTISLTFDVSSEPEASRYINQVMDNEDDIAAFVLDKIKGLPVAYVEAYAQYSDKYKSIGRSL